MKKKTFGVDLAPYPYKVMVSIGQTPVELAASLAREKIHPEHINEVTNQYRKSHTGTAIAFPNGNFLLRLTHLPKDPKSHGCLAHEVFHIVSMVMARIDCPLEVQVSDEPYAYLIGHLTEKIYAGIS